MHEPPLDLSKIPWSRHKEVVRVFYKEMWDHVDTALLQQILHADFTFRGSLGPQLVGHEQFVGYVKLVNGALDRYTSESPVPEWSNAAMEPSMTSTRISQYINAPRASVYRALLDPRAVATWKVPAGMTCHVHSFDAREGGSFRISLTYNEPTAIGKSTAHTDTYHGYFAQLVPDERVVELAEFETEDPALRGEMTTTMTLADAGGGTHLFAVHDRLPPGLSPADNETGWRMALAKLAALVEAGG